MSMTDPIADMLTRIRNASMAKHEEVDIPASKLKLAIAKILKEEGYVKGYRTLREPYPGVIRIALKYTPDERPVITGLKRVSKPGCRVYVKRDEIPRVQGGLGIAILSTPRGVHTDRRCRELGVGGELLCYIW